jgi:hypothetical protein
VVMDDRNQGVSRSDRILLAVHTGIPVAGNLQAITTVVYALWSLPPGTNIRPMGLAMWIILVGIGTPIVGISVAIVTPFLRRTRPLILWSAFFCALLSCTPLFTGMLTYRYIVEHHRLVDSK